MIFVGKGHKNRASFSLFPSNGQSQRKLHFILFFVRFPMKMKVNGRRGVFWQHTFEGENVRLPNRLNALERLEQRLSAHLADARNPVERRAGRGLRVALVVERDGKAVRLLLDLTDQGEDVRRGVQVDLAALRGDERARAVAVVLDHAEDRHVHVHLRAHALGDARVRDAAVDEHDVRQGAELLIAVQIALDAAREHLLHGRVVVRVGRQALDLESPVGTLLGLCALVDDHRRDDVARAGVGNIVGFHAFWRGAQTAHGGMARSSAFSPRWGTWSVTLRPARSVRICASSSAPSISQGSRISRGSTLLLR